MDYAGYCDAKDFVTTDEMTVTCVIAKILYSVRLSPKHTMSRDKALEVSPEN